MTNYELQQELAKFPADMPIKIMVDHQSMKVHDFTDDHILQSSETAFIDRDAPEDEWDHEDGRIELGDGQRYLLFNPIIV